VGSTSQPPEDRLNQHNTAYFGSTCFSARASDWTIFLTITCDSIEQALKIEKHIKRMHSRKYFCSLKEHPDIVEKLLSFYS